MTTPDPQHGSHGDGGTVEVLLRRPALRNLREVIADPDKSISDFLGALIDYRRAVRATKASAPPFKKRLKRRC